MSKELLIRYLNNNKLCLVGISHLLKDINKSIEYIFEYFQPDLLVLELDSERYSIIKDILDSGNLNQDQLNLDGFRNKWININDDSYEFYNDNYLNLQDEQFKSIELIKILENLQWSLSRKKEILLGLEFFTAIKLAEKYKIPIELIDISLDEFINELKQIDKNILNKLVEEFKKIDLNEIEKEYDNLILNINNEEFIHKLILQLKKEHPEFYEVLITNRDKKMASRINEIVKNNSDLKTLIIVGAGHFNGILKELNF